MGKRCFIMPQRETRVKCAMQENVLTIQEPYSGCQTHPSLWCFHSSSFSASSSIAYDASKGNTHTLANATLNPLADILIDFVFASNFNNPHSGVSNKCQKTFLKSIFGVPISSPHIKSSFLTFLTLFHVDRNCVTPCSWTNAMYFLASSNVSGFPTFSNPILLA